ncbi:MAG TPA: hypothetical protein VIN65_06265 [Candidatus Dormibacteraeota bacterium]|jgi:hypothetical protein
MTAPGEPGTAPSATPPPRQAATRRSRWRNPFFTLLVGLLVGLAVGVAGGYLIFNGRTVAITTTPQATATPSPSATPVRTSTPLPATSQPVQTAVSAPQGVVACPVTTPTGQHPLGSPGAPGAGQHATAGLDFCGGGSATIPTGASRFTTSANWGVGIANSCPVGSSGQAGMNTVLTVTEIIPGGGQGPDTATESGDWQESGTVLMPTGGNYQLRVTAVSPGCVWHIAVYPS